MVRWHPFCGGAGSHGALEVAADLRAANPSMFCGFQGLQVFALRKEGG